MFILLRTMDVSGHEGDVEDLEDVEEEEESGKQH